VPEPGGEATIQVVTGTRDVLVVPRVAVRTEHGRSFVHVIPASGKQEAREVVVGSPAPEGRVEVSGVRKGESVAVWE
jgi:threonine dehydrogenase-like Zn-dependent dehydrogenase